MRSRISFRLRSTASDIVVERDHEETVGDLRRHGDQRIAGVLLGLLHGEVLDGADPVAIELIGQGEDNLDQMARRKRLIGIALDGHDCADALFGHIDLRFDGRFRRQLIARGFTHDVPYDRTLLGCRRLLPEALFVKVHLLSHHRCRYRRLPGVDRTVVCRRRFNLRRRAFGLGRIERRD